MIAWTIRLALLAYFAALAVAWRRESSTRWRRFERLMWTAGCVLAWAHLAAAFHFRHHWSHAHAAEETTRRTVEVVGWSLGGEIFFNYAFVAAWTGDVLWRWMAPQTYERRIWPARATVHGFLFFMIFNATVVFETGAIRAAAIAACLFLAALMLRATFAPRRSESL